MTDSGRYAVLAPAADALVTRLQTSFDITSADVAPGDLTPPGLTVDVARAVRLTPREGAPLTVAFTTFPGLLVHWGHWSQQRLPDCGCDACDEQPDDLLELLAQLLADVVGGRTVETLTRRHLQLQRPHSGSRTLLLAAERQAMVAIAPAGRYAWPAWPRS